MGFLQVIGPDRSGQAINIFVGKLCHLVNIVKRKRGQHGTKNFFLGNLHVVVHAAEDRRLNKVTVVAIDLRAFAAGQQLCAFAFAGFDVAQHRLHLLSRSPRRRAGSWDP